MFNIRSISTLSLTDEPYSVLNIKLSFEAIRRSFRPLRLPTVVPNKHSSLKPIKRSLILSRFPPSNPYPY